MIDIVSLKDFLKEAFPLSQLYLDEFKPDLQFAEINCFDDKPYKLLIEIGTDMIQISTLSKEPQLDFSLYEYAFKTNKDAEEFILKVKAKGEFPFRSGVNPYH